MRQEDEEGGDDDAGASKGAKWASYFSRRKLSALANSPLGAVSTPPPTGASSSPQSVGYTYPVTFNPSLLEDLDPSAPQLLHPASCARKPAGVQGPVVLRSPRLSIPAACQPGPKCAPSSARKRGRAP